MKKLFPLYLLLLFSFDLSLAERVIYLAHGRVYSVDLNHKDPQVIFSPASGERIISLVVLPKAQLIVYALQEYDTNRSSVSLWLAPLDGKGHTELLKTDFTKIELCDFSADEKRIVFQAQSADSFAVCYLNLQSGEFLQLPSAYSPRFLTNTKVLVLADPSQPGFCYHLLAGWDIAKQKLDTLAYTPETCNRVLNISNARNLLALVSSDASTQLNEYIDILDTAGQIVIHQAAASSGLIKILGGPDFSPGNKHIAWVAEHWLLVTDLQTKETKKIAERLLTDDFAWSPYGGEILIAFKPSHNPKECPTCPKTMLKKSPGLFTVGLSGEILERVAYTGRVEKQVFWIR